MKEQRELSEQELNERAKELASILEEITELRAALKLTTKEYKNQIESLENSAARLARIVRSGFEDVEIELQPELFKETAC